MIPGGDAAGLPYNGSTQVAKNWTTAGKATFFGSACGAMTPTEFYNIEIAAGRTPAEAIDDPNDQGANEDAALLAALGGTFTLANVTTWSTAVTVNTLAATGVALSVATINGTLTVGSTQTATSFQYGTDPALATSTTIAASPSTATNTTTVTAQLADLIPATTYFFRVLGTTNAGSDTEGVLYGAILTFRTGDPPTTTEPTTTTELTTSTTSETTTTSTTTAPTTTSTTTAPTTTSTTTAPTMAPATTAPTTTSTTMAPATTTDTAAAVDVTPTSPTEPAPTSPVAIVPTTSPVSPTGAASIRGLVWFDRNRDGAFNGTEWILPGVTVTIASRAPAPASMLVATSHAETVTASDGSYRFEGVVPGEYIVSAKADIDGFDYTSDTDGAADWAVAVIAAPNTTGVADFAGLGRGEVQGQVFDAVSLAGLPAATVSCRWGGFDDVLGTPDDVVFQVTSDDSGRFAMRGVPYGVFTCDGFDQTSGRTSSVAAATVLGPEPVEAPLPIAPSSAPLPIEAPHGGLPNTGTAPITILVTAMLAVLAGLASTVVRRRPPVTSRASGPPE